jgi:AraC-like DNA-binding protein
MRYIIRQEEAEVTYISGGHFVSKGAWIHPRMTLSDYELVVVVKGRFWLTIKGVKREFRKGDCFILFPEEEHYGTEEAWEVSFYWVHFKLQEKEEIIEGEQSFRTWFRKIEKGVFPGIILNEFSRQEETARLIVMINHLLHYQSVFKETEEASRPCNLMMELVLYELTQVTKKETMEKLSIYHEEEGDMEKIYEYIRATCYKNPQVFEIAKHFGYNTQYFIRMFRKAAGVTPKQYMINRQMERAKYLLTTTSLKIKEIAEQVGMSDSKSFFKNFKKQEGISPNEYRRIFQKTHYNSH